MYEKFIELNSYFGQEITTKRVCFVKVSTKQWLEFAKADIKNRRNNLNDILKKYQGSDRLGHFFSARWYLHLGRSAQTA